MKVPKDRSSAWHLFPIQLNIAKLKKTRKQVFESFHKAGIKVQVHYIPIHLHPYYQRMFKYKIGDFPNSELYYKQEISLPLFPKMTDHDIKRVIEVTRQLTNA